MKVYWKQSPVADVVRDWVFDLARDVGFVVCAETEAEILFDCELFPDDPDSEAYEIKDNGKTLMVRSGRTRGFLYGWTEVFEALSGHRWIDGRVSPYACAPATRPLTKAACFDFPNRLSRSHPSLGVDGVRMLVLNRFNGVSFEADILSENNAILRQQFAEAQRLDMDITVGGHLVGQLVPADEWFDAQPELFAQVRGERRRSGHLCYANPEAAELLKRKLVEWVENLHRACPAMVRFSVWSEDSGEVCECPLCRGQPFNDLFCRVVESAGEELKNRGLPVRLETIVYNALGGRSREEAFATLEPPSRMNGHADCLFAYWGRDYSHSIADPRNDFDVKGGKLLEKAQKICLEAGVALNVFEYYPDFWQFGDVFPFLGPVIWEDIRSYYMRGVQGIWHCLDACPLGWEGYPVRELECVHFHFAGLAMWDSSRDYKEVFEEFLQALFGDHSGVAGDIFRTLFRALAPLTWLNLQHPVPGLSGTRLWHWSSKHEVFDFDPEDPRLTRISDPHLSLFHDALSELKHVLPLSEALTEACGFTGQLAGYVVYVHTRIQAVIAHLRAQDALRKSDDASYREAFEEGLKLDRSTGGLLQKELEEWRE